MSKLYDLVILGYLSRLYMILPIPLSNKTQTDVVIMDFSKRLILYL